MEVDYLCLLSHLLRLLSLFLDMAHHLNHLLLRLLLRLEADRLRFDLRLTQRLL